MSLRNANGVYHSAAKVAFLLNSQSVFITNKSLQMQLYHLKAHGTRSQHSSAQHQTAGIPDKHTAWPG